MTWQLVALPAAAAGRDGDWPARELLAWPDAVPASLRLTLLDLHGAGTFTKVPGHADWLAPLGGAALRVQVGAASQCLAPDTGVLQWNAAVAASCVPMPAQAQALHLAAPAGRARLRRVAGAGAFELRGDRLVGVYAHGRAAAIATMETVIDVPPFHLAWCRRTWAATGTVTGEDALWFDVRP